MLAFSGSQSLAHSPHQLAEKKKHNWRPSVICALVGTKYITETPVTKHSTLEFLSVLGVNHLRLLCTFEVCFGAHKCIHPIKDRKGSQSL